MLKILSQIEEGIRAYHILEEGDRILAAISGGKDSLTMLHFLKQIQASSKVHFDLSAVHIKTDFHCGSCVHREMLKDVFERLDVPYVIKDIKVLDEQKQTNCFWCSWCRRKCLFETARELGCNKIAFGHHKDDIVETVLLNLFFKGEISTMTPNQEMFKGEIRLIRPLCLVDEALIKQFAQENNFPHQMCRCPYGAVSQRKTMKSIIDDFSNNFPTIDVRNNIFKSLSNIKM
ncbi:MAG: adenine nucleotide alpha hydrolase family protein [Candidatus Omnitrophica bacterium]|nr:adenine nucleotide alpha hydrolase family protein [Candidatus Omnitrophota bacterium]